MAKKTEKNGAPPSVNPFEPSGSGAPLLADDFWLPEQSWKIPLLKRLDELDSGHGHRAIAIVGEYGSGKSYILRWLERVEFPSRKILSYYFENPEVRFYDLANALLRRIGRKRFAKLLYELADEHRRRKQGHLFGDGFEAYISNAPVKPSQYQIEDFQTALKKAGITDDDEIAYCLARVVVETARTPYFEYRHFVTSKTGSYVAEKQEHQFFDAILRVLRLGEGVKRVAFLLDEFEQVSLHQKLTRKDAQDYLVTLKRLVDATESGDLWIVLAMTPAAADNTSRLDPAFWSRCYRFDIKPLTKAEAAKLVRRRLKQASADFPFADDFVDALQATTLANPRRLVKVFHVAMNAAARRGQEISTKQLAEIDRELYPSGGQ
jgi:type II secretory pathway predicted ATPase ExeA